MPRSKTRKKYTRKFYCLCGKSFPTAKGRAGHISGSIRHGGTGHGVPDPRVKPRSNGTVDKVDSIALIEDAHKAMMAELRAMRRKFDRIRSILDE